MGNICKCTQWYMFMQIKCREDIKDVQKIKPNMYLVKTDKRAKKSPQLEVLFVVEEGGEP